MRGYRKPPAICRVTAELPFNGVTLPPDSPEFEWPSLEYVKTVQQEHSSNKPKSAAKDKDGIIIMNGASWIPDECVDLKLRILTIAHAGNAGHRGSDSTWNAIRERFAWKDLREDTKHS